MLLSGRADLSDEAPIFPSHVFSNLTLQKLSTLHTTSLNFRRLSSHFLFVAIQHLKHLCYLSTDGILFNPPSNTCLPE
jgi:hypothetical protein